MPYLLHIPIHHPCLADYKSVTSVCLIRSMLPFSVDIVPRSEPARSTKLIVDTFTGRRSSPDSLTV